MKHGRYSSQGSVAGFNNNNSNTQTMSTGMVTGYRRSMDSKMEGGHMNNNHSHIQQYHNHSRGFSDNDINLLINITDAHNRTRHVRT